MSKFTTGFAVAAVALVLQASAEPQVRCYALESLRKQAPELRRGDPQPR